MTDALDFDGPNPWRTESSRVVYDNGLLRLCEDQVVQPDGEPGTYAYAEVEWPVVAIVPVADDGYVYLVRQWRYPWGCNSWEIPAGHCEPNEDPLDGAQRELAEEVGMRASTWEPLGRGFASASLNAHFYLFLASGLSPVAHAIAREGTERDLIARRISVADAVAAAMDGRIAHGMSVVGVLRAARWLGW